MSAGFTYNLTPEVEKEERYDVQSGIRRRGSFILDTTNLPAGSRLPSFAPVKADLKNRKCSLVRNFTVAAAYTTGETALTLKVAKGCFPYAGMHIGNGSKGATVSAVDFSDADYDALTLGAAFGVDLAVGAVIFEATAVNGKTKKAVANSALYGSHTVESGINNVALLRTAAEIEPDKLAIPYATEDKEALKGWFQFNE
jgi:hypothetical protein